MNKYVLKHVPSGENIGFVELDDETVKNISTEAHQLTINMWQAGTTHAIESFVLHYTPCSKRKTLCEDPHYKGVECKNSDCWWNN